MTAAAKPFTVDLAQQTIDGSVHFAIAPRRKQMLLEELEEIGSTMAMEPKIAAFQAADRARRPWIHPARGPLCLTAAAACI